MTFHIGILVFPSVQQLDLTGPYEVFASIPDAKVHLIWKDRSAITSATGLVLAPTMTFAECPALDVLCVPGGGGINALLQDAEVLGFLRAQAARARYVSSVCTGSLVLGAAGLLKGPSRHDTLGLARFPREVRGDPDAWPRGARRQSVHGRASISASRSWPSFLARRRRRRSNSRTNMRPSRHSGPERRRRRRRRCSPP